MTKFKHVFIYAALSLSYLGVAFGFDKMLVSMATAGLYMLLASDEWRKG